jgi:hypothetical protein
MSISLENSISPSSRFWEVLPYILKKSRHTEIWGVDLRHAEWQVLEVVLNKVQRQRARTEIHH